MQDNFNFFRKWKMTNRRLPNYFENIRQPNFFVNGRWMFFCCKWKTIYFVVGRQLKKNVNCTDQPQLVLAFRMYPRMALLFLRQAQWSVINATIGNVEEDVIEEVTNESLPELMEVWPGARKSGYKYLGNEYWSLPFWEPGCDCFLWSCWNPSLAACYWALKGMNQFHRFVLQI